MNDAAAKFGLTQLPSLPTRDPGSHKGSFGRALLVGGSRGMSGAAILMGLGGLRSGSGLVFVAVPDGIQQIVASAEPSYLTVDLPADPDGRISGDARTKIVEQVEAANAFGFGPGLGRSPGLTALSSWLYQNPSQPMVIDADGLNALAQLPEAMEAPGGPRVLTPHPGEFARLIGGEPRLVQENRPQLATQFAQRYDNMVLVLKGHQTVITDGKRTIINPTGNPGMASGGCGDVLTGIVTGLLAQGMDPFDAAWLGVYAHGLAGDLAAAELGEISLIASDLVRFLPHAFRQLSLSGRVQ